MEQQYAVHERRSRSAQEQVSAVNAKAAPANECKALHYRVSTRRGVCARASANLAAQRCAAAPSAPALILVLIATLRHNMPASRDGSECAGAGRQRGMGGRRSCANDQNAAISRTVSGNGCLFGFRKANLGAGSVSAAQARAAARRRRTEPLYMGSSPPVYSKRFIFQKGM